MIHFEFIFASVKKHNSVVAVCLYYVCVCACVSLYYLCAGCTGTPELELQMCASHCGHCVGAVNCTWVGSQCR